MEMHWREWVDPQEGY